jgi:hypothetical protein
MLKIDILPTLKGRDSHLSKQRKLIEQWAGATTEVDLRFPPRPFRVSECPPALAGLEDVNSG